MAFSIAIEDSHAAIQYIEGKIIGATDQGIHSWPFGLRGAFPSQASAVGGPSSRSRTAFTIDLANANLDGAIFKGAKGLQALRGFDKARNRDKAIF